MAGLIEPENLDSSHEKVYRGRTSAEVDIILKSALRLRIANSHPIGLSRPEVWRENDIVQVKWTVSRALNPPIFAVEPLLTAYQFDEGKPRFENKDTGLKIYEAKAGLPERRFIIKLICTGPTNAVRYINEAFLQIEAEGHTTCKIFDISFQQTKKKVSVGLVMERLEQDLDADILYRAALRKPYTEEELLAVFIDIAEALVFMKKQVSAIQGLAHLDIKPPNIFKDGTRCKLGDFGSAVRIRDSMLQSDGTPEYLSPEMRRFILAEEVDVNMHKTDIFSLGVTMLHAAKLVMPKKVPYAWANSERLQEAVELELHGLSYSDRFKDLLRNMLKMDPAERPDIEAILTALKTGFASATEPADATALDRRIFEMHLKRTEIVILTLLQNYDALSASYRDNLDIAFAHYYLLSNRTSESKSLFGALVSRLSTSQGPFDVRVVPLMTLLAEALIIEGRIDDAEELLRDSAALLLHHCEFRHKGMIPVLGNLARVYALQLKLEDAARVLRECIEQSRNLLGADCEETLRAVLHYGNVLSLAGRYAEGEAQLSQCLERSEELFGASYPLTADCYLALAVNRLAQGEASEAEALATVARNIREQAGHPVQGALDLLLATACHMQGKHEEAANWRQRISDVCISHGQRPADASVQRLWQLQKHWENRDWAETETLCTQILTKQVESGPIEQANCLLTLSSLYTIQGKLQEAEAQQAKMSTLLASLPPAHDLVYWHRLSLAHIYTLQGRLAEADQQLNHIVAERHNEEPGMELLPETLVDFFSGRLHNPIERFEQCVQVLKKYGGDQLITQAIESIVRSF